MFIYKALCRLTPYRATRARLRGSGKYERARLCGWSRRRGGVGAGGLVGSSQLGAVAVVGVGAGGLVGSSQLGAAAVVGVGAGGMV